MLPYAKARLRMVLNRFWPLRPARAVMAFAFGLFGVAFGAGDYLFFHRIFGNLLATPAVPSVILTALAAKLMGLVLLTTFTLLIFSAAVSALSYLYLDDDLGLLLPLPIRPWALIAARATQAAANAGYMVALILAPVIAAYANLYPRPLAALFAGLVGLALYLASPLCWGVGFTVLLARFFPARRLHQMLTILSVVMLCLLVVLFRLSKPEVLLNPASSMEAMTVLKSIEMPVEGYLPSTWLALLIVRSAEGNWPEALPGLARLAWTALASLAIAAVLLRKFHWTGFTRAQEHGSSGDGGRLGALGRLLLGAALFAVPAGQRARAILRRDALHFFRDPTQWGQLFILGALVIIYLFNVRHMPKGTVVFQVAVAYWNLATLGLIVSAVAGRFAFAAVGSEGEAYFVSRTLPISAGRYLWAKFLFSSVPLTAMAVAILYGSNRFLGVKGVALAYTVFLGVAASLTLSVLALAMGCADPVFDAKNPAKSVMSAWGLLYMFLSLLYLGWILVVSAKPVYQYYAGFISSGPKPEYLLAALRVSALSLGAIVIAFILARKRLSSLEPL